MRITSACLRSFLRESFLSCTNLIKMRADRFVASYISTALFWWGTLLLLAPAPATAQTANSSAAEANTAPSSATKAAPSSATKTAPPKPTATSAAAKKRKARPRPQMTPTAARISEIQSALAARGSYKGEPNGKWDDSTAQAMKDFQSANGLTPTGKLDALSLQKLGLGSEIAGRAAPVPMPQTPAAPASSQQQTP
jgi:peptidoglycan hydrolase-like protein with peptidoglycan-binding domain